MNNGIPSWLMTQENYSPSKDNDNFIDKSTLCLLRVLSKIKMQNTYNEKYPEAVSLRLIFILLLITLTSCSKNLHFVLFIVAGILIRLCFINGKNILKIFKLQICTLLLSILILSPSAILMNNLNSCFFILIKIYASTTLMMIFSISTQWNSLSSSLKNFRIPDTFIFIFDTTLKYIVLLGNLSLNMLTALKLRSVGINNHKQKSMSAIAGTTFIKSTEMAEDMFSAMACRGFTGEYKITSKKIYKPVIVYYVICSLMAILLFIYMK
ncbi:MAG: energy-coupling factor transporter transmembrane component T [Clostridium sp.]|nr:energy-coupling factor transporter transmembrane component T [Clostridium sp.]